VDTQLLISQYDGSPTEFRPGDLAFVRGADLVGGLIRWLTCSDVNHVRFIADPSGAAIEAVWPAVGWGRVQASDLLGYAGFPWNFGRRGALNCAELSCLGLRIPTSDVSPGALLSRCLRTSGRPWEPLPEQSYGLTAR
jgi:hypothetical protein